MVMYLVKLSYIDIATGHKQNLRSKNDLSYQCHSDDVVDDDDGSLGAEVSGDRDTCEDDEEADEVAEAGTDEEEADVDVDADVDADDADARVRGKGSDADVDGPGNWSSRLELPRAASGNTYKVSGL